MRYPSRNAKCNFDSAMGRLTTHILDTAHGCPAAGVELELYRLGEQRELVASAVTNADGRCYQPVLADDAFQVGEYELVFHIGDYFAGRGVALSEPRFLDRVSIRFGISARDEHYHVPLLVSPYGYSTYRGS